MSYVTGTQILTQVGKSAPTAEDTAWAAKCAGDIQAEVELYLEGNTPSANQILILEVAALSDACALFQSKNAPHGILSMGPDGEAVRLGADDMRSLYPVLHRVHPTAGIGIG